MIESDPKYLFNLFQSASRDHVYLVRFADGEEFEITDVSSGQDIDEPPHAIASVLRIILGKRRDDWESGEYLFYYSSEIAQLVEPKSGEVLFQSATK